MNTTGHTYHIHLKGQVQGVGFRPFVYKLALEHGLHGWVNNDVDGVHIEINAEQEERALLFFAAVQQKAPALAHITYAQMWRTQGVLYRDFRIVHSAATAKAQLLLTPDIALCALCRQELTHGQNRRFGYPFITCTLCGPRYSIITRLPYDRLHTAMQAFRLCPECQAEYDDPLNRRYYSQTNSCSACGIALQWYEPGQGLQSHSADECLARTTDYILAGKIVAIKGVGGFLLCCDATNEDAIQTLRQRKRRPSKPLALLYPSVDALAQDTLLTPHQIFELQGAVSPIVLAELKLQTTHPLCLPLIAPGQRHLGAMIPYAPLLELLMRRLPYPIVATSGNVSNAPIVFDNDTALRELPAIADAVLFHNRDIVTPVDDSVVRFSPTAGQRILLRRARGLAPTLVLPGFLAPAATVLGMGALMKSAFALVHQGNLYLSQYLGDLENFDTEHNFLLALQHLLTLFDTKPQHVVADLHPDYYSTRLGQTLAEEWGATFLQVQHHEAHFAASLTEHDLLQQGEPVLGVIWDGLGLGDDGHVWGGEFFRYHKGQIARIGHLEYFPYLLGDKMSREPRIAALAACHTILPQVQPLLHEQFTTTEWQVYQQVLSQPSPLQCSSVGRLFDAAAALLGLITRSSYEGEAAMLLENTAWAYFRQYGLEAFFGLAPSPELYQCTPADLLLPIAQGRLNGEEAPYLAARFHAQLTQWIAQEAKYSGCRHIAFSGGVFQNALLVDLCIAYLGTKYKLHFHDKVSPNDENIALGQVALHTMRHKSL